MYLTFPIVWLNILSIIAAQNTPQHPSNSWSGWAGNIYNNRWASTNRFFSSSSISSLSLTCKQTYLAGVSATPTIQGNIAYYPTWGGSFVALDYTTCTTIWQINVSSIIENFAPVPASILDFTLFGSRTSPQIDGDVVYFGTSTHGLLIAVNLYSGAFLSAIKINPHPLAVVTMSPTLYNGVVFVGVSSSEEEAADLPTYECCSFAANFVAVKLNEEKNGFSTLWNVSMLPQNHGNWSGAALWGSQPSIDVVRNQVYIATGNVYLAPLEYLECQNRSLNGLVVNGVVTGGPEPCLPKDIWQESILALDIDTGKVNWVRQITPLDAFTNACGIPGVAPYVPANCPETPGPDSDFAMAPTFVPGSSATPHGQDILVIGQKNGIIHTLSAEDGTNLWSVLTSPGSAAGGLGWGIAIDNTQVYFTAMNSLDVPFQLQPSDITVSYSAYGALSLLDGSAIWGTPSPYNSSARMPPTVVGDLVLTGTTANAPDFSSGALVVVNKVNGEVLLDVGLDTGFHGGIAVQDEYVLFGTGYYPSGNATGSFFVMKVSGKRL